MSRFTYLIVAIAIAVFPTQGISGQISFELPFSLLGMATCVAPSIEEVKASCNWERNKKKGYDISCDVNRNNKSVKDEISVRMNTWRIDKSAVSQAPGAGRRLTYKYRGIKCTIFFPPSTSGLKCTKNAGGFSCKWCAKRNCYQGKATIR